MAFRYFREHNVERVHQSLKVVSDEIDTQGEKSPAEKNVGDVNLQQAIKQV